MKLYTDMQNTAAELAMILAPESSKQNELDKKSQLFREFPFIWLNILNAVERIKPIFSFKIFLLSPNFPLFGLTVLPRIP
jgi:hypothetical protein